MIIRRISRIIVSLLCFAWLSGLHAEQVFYVFKDRNGRTQLQDHIPENLKHLGYRIVNANGVTLQVIPPSKKQRSGTKAAQPATYSDEDLRLLQRYASVHDIEVARDRQLGNLDSIITSIKEHTAAFERNLADMQRREEELRNKNKPVNSKLKKDMQTIADRIKGNREYLTRKMAEYSLLSDRFENDMERFRVLQSRH